MKTAILLLLFAITSVVADTIVMDNQTGYPSKNAGSSIGIEWASSLQELNAKGNDTKNQVSKKPDFQLENPGKIEVTLPPNAKYFRVNVWSDNSATPTLVSSWVLIVPKKEYTLEEADLYPASLESGTGC